MLNLKNRLRYFLILLVLIPGFNTNSFAADKHSNSLGLEEITVTADKREENLLDVPTAITAMTDLDMEDAGIEDVEDVVDYVPNMKVESSYIPGRNEMNFRGMHMSAFTEKNPVVIFIDGIPQDSLVNYGPNLINVERVEVLRGSQGTIYGKNAIGGVINIISRKPQNKYESKIIGEIAENETYRCKGFVNGPIIKDKLFFSAAGGYYGTRGFLENKNSGEDYFDDEENININSRIMWVPSDSTEINFHSNITQTSYGSSGTIKVDDNKVKFYSNKNPDDFADADNFSTALNMRFSNSLCDFKTLTTYSYDDVEVSQDQSFVKPDKQMPTSVSDYNINSITQEFRLQSKEKDKGLKWIGGVFFSKETLKYDKLGKEYNTKETLGYNVLYNWADDNEELTSAVFGQLTIPLPSRFFITAGLRYERIHKEMDYRYEILRTDNNSVLPVDPFPYGADTRSFVTYDINDDWNALLPKGAISWKPNNNLNIYTSVSKGYQAGGFNWCENISENAKFDEQYSIDYELGLKSTWFKKRLMINVNLFYMDIKDMHVYTAPDPLTYLTSNAGEAHSQGIEMELRIKPFRGFDIISSLGLIDAEYDEYTNTSGVDCGGNALEGTPKHTFNIAAQYRSRSGFFGRVGLESYGEYYFDGSNTIKQDSYQVYNAKFGYESKNWDIYVYGKNLFDEEYFSYGRLNASGFVANVGEPKVFGLIASIRF